MANPEHLAILKQGVEVWNRWRQARPEVQPHLTEADLRLTELRGANLSKVDLRGADLRGAELDKANLTEADFTKANLYGAFLIGVELIRANLTEADLYGVHLDKADLIGADLIKADLTGAHLDGTNLHGARLDEASLRGASLRRTNFSNGFLGGADLSLAFFDETILGNANLTAAKGLESCIHIRSSIIDHRTLAKSGPLPLSFLRGCGLPEILINYLPSLLNQPIQFYSVFISYSGKDQDFAERLHADLQNKGVRCWFAPEDLKIGDKIRSRLDESIRVHDKLLLVLSENSIESEWVEKEVETAFGQEKEQGHTVLFPIRLDGAVMDKRVGWVADIHRTRLIGDFTRWKEHDQYQKAFERLLRDLKADEPQSDG